MFIYLFIYLCRADCQNPGGIFCTQICHSSMFLSLFVNSAFALKAETLTDCPSNLLGHEFSEAVSLSGCNCKSPTGLEDFWLSVNHGGTDLIEIADSTFRTFTKAAIRVLSLGVVALTGLDFQGFVSYSQVLYAVSVAYAREFFASGLRFSDFTEFGAIDDNAHGASLSDGVKDMLNFFDLVLTNVSQVSWEGIIESGFVYIYADGLNFTKCSGNAGFAVSQNHGVQVPIFSRLVFDEMIIPTGGDLVSGVAGQYFVVEKWVFKDTPCLFQSQISVLYCEDTQFFGTDEARRTGLTANGGLSLIDCSFTKLGTGLEGPASAFDMFVCRCTFTDCAQCIWFGIDANVELVGCVFASYTELGVYNRMTHLDRFLIRKCAFLGDGVAISSGSGATVKGSCFVATSNVFNLTKEDAKVVLGEDVRIAASSAEASKVGGLGTVEGGTWGQAGCTESAADLGSEVCVGGNLPPRPTPFATRSHVSSVDPPRTPSFCFAPSLLFTPSSIFPPSLSFAPSLIFPPSLSFAPSLIFPSSLSFTPSLIFRPSLSFAPSLRVNPSLIFPPFGISDSLARSRLFGDRSVVIFAPSQVLEQAPHRELQPPRVPRRVLNSEAIRL
jgi:hypothetical protein